MAVAHRLLVRTEHERFGIDLIALPCVEGCHPKVDLVGTELTAPLLGSELRVKVHVDDAARRERRDDRNWQVPDDDIAGAERFHVDEVTLDTVDAHAAPLAPLDRALMPCDQHTHVDLLPTQPDPARLARRIKASSYCPSTPLPWRRIDNAPATLRAQHRSAAQQPHGQPRYTRAMATQLAPGLLEIDTKLGGWHHITAGFLVEGASPVLIETGSQSSAPTLIAELAELGVAPEELAAIVVTHIHLDHAGGVGDLARAFPKATVYVHPAGARHLADPSRLVASAAQVYGPLLDELYGRLDPTPAERIVALEHGQRIRVTDGLDLEVLQTPGHAKHHVSLFHEASGTMFCGDAVGVKLPDVGVLWPATPPPDFDLDKALASLAAMGGRHPTHLAFAHYGRFAGAAELLAEAADQLHAWCDVAERALREGREVESALAEAFLPTLDEVDAQARERLLTLSGIHANATGIERWLKLREEGRAGDEARA